MIYISFERFDQLISQVEITVHDNKFHHAESAVFIHANLLYVFKKKFVKKFSFMLWEINDDLLYDVMSVLVAD